MTLSLCMIVKNESDVLARCLSCMEGIADEIIIVDTGSDDRTQDIARQFTTHVYEFPWSDDFSAARNFSFSKATMDYTMWLDADDYLSEKNRFQLQKLKETLSTDMAFLRYDVAFDAQGNPTLSYYRERIVRTSLKYHWTGEIHEIIVPQGSIGYFDIHIEHRKLHPTEKGRNLRIFRKMLADGKTLDSRQQFYYARELMYNGDDTAAEAAFLQFLDGGQGWVENQISACLDLCRCQERLGKPDAALATLLRSFTYDVPRAEICCEIGKVFLSHGQYRTAAFWYETAAASNPAPQNGGFCQIDCYGYIPCMQLCVCYDHLGEREKDETWNEKAGALKPNDPAYLYNCSYFAAQKKEA
jgi:tetratricopeptide (TPR) repeat protein